MNIMKRRNYWNTKFSSPLLAILISLCLLLIGSAPSKVNAQALPTRPLRGSIPWSILLCTFSDSIAPPYTTRYFEDMFTGTNTGGLNDYLQDISYGNVNLNGSVVRGWFTEPFTLEQAQSRDRGQQFQDCINAAKNDPSNPYTIPTDHRIAVVTFPGLDLFGILGGGAFIPASANLGDIAHEVAHGLGLNHSFSNDPDYQSANWSQIGEYDDEWDLMSWGHVHTTSTAQFGVAPPGLNAFHLDRMGWLPGSRIFTFGADGSYSRTITLAALNSPGSTGYMLARVPFDPNDPYRYYTIELRRRAEWDRGIPGNIVLIHEAKLGAGGQYYSYLLRSENASRSPIQTLETNGVKITINSVSANGEQATVTITGNIADRCLTGYVWREASPSDHVCVTPAIREQTWRDNDLAMTRRSLNGGPYGPDTCLQGYVWREAFPGDHACVTPQTREQAWADNAQAINRQNPARFVYGPNTCKQGFVWREADALDYVCVTPNIRTQTHNDNSQAFVRRNPNGGPYGPDTCLQGYVWREAFPGDHACVTPQTREQAWADNAQAGNRLAQP